MTIMIIWTVYNPYTGDCLYTGTDIEQARLALVSKTMQGYIMHPIAAQIESTEQVRRARVKAAK